MREIIKDRIHFTEGMLFEIRITSRYLTLMGNQAFEKLHFNLSFEEYLIMDIISYNEGICQRDLARLLLRDRSNLGKIASSLEKKKMLIYGHFWHNKHGYQRIIGALKFKNKYPALFSYINNSYITPVEANELYGKSKICINIHQDIHLGPNPRTFEILGNGNFQLCDNQDFTGIDLIDKQDLVILLKSGREGE